MLRGDKLARTIEYPKAFSGDSFDPEAFFQFAALTKRPESPYVISVGSRFLLKTVSGVHAYGAEIAAGKNARYLKDHGTEPNPVVAYLGFYDVYAGEVQKISLEFYVQTIRWVPENGREAHFQIELHMRRTGTKRELKEDRRKARAALYDHCIGPTLCPEASEKPSLLAIMEGLEEKPDWCLLPQV